MNSPTQSVIHETQKKLERIFGVTDVSVIIQEKPEKTLPETGMSGFTPDSHTIYIYTDSGNENFKLHELKRTLAHEFHHAVRNRTYNWKQDTLLGAMVTEGLADHFDMQVNGGNPKPWSIALNNAEITKFMEMAKPELDSREYNHSDWFFGSKDRNIPKWTGYAIGFKLVSDYINKSGKNAAELVAENAKSFLKVYE